MVARTLLLVLVWLTLEPTAWAQSLVSHSVIYDVKPAKGDAELFFEGQATFTLARRCDGWSLGEVFQFGIEKGAAAVAQKKVTDKGMRFEERLNAQESLDGRSLSYQTRLRQNARVTAVTGTATLGADG